MNQTKYAKETQTAVFQGKPITVTHFTPIFPANERERRKKEIEHELYDVFAKKEKNKRRAG